MVPDQIQIVRIQLQNLQENQELNSVAVNFHAWNQKSNYEVDE
jgi:hypothetical protein